MPWQEGTRMSLREEFVKLALQAGANRREAVPALQDSAEDRATKWLLRYAEARPRRA